MFPKFINELRRSAESIGIDIFEQRVGTLQVSAKVQVFMISCKFLNYIFKNLGIWGNFDYQ